MDKDEMLKVLIEIKNGGFALFGYESELWTKVEASLQPVQFQDAVSKFDFSKLRRVSDNEFQTVSDDVDVCWKKEYEEAILCLIAVASCVKENLSVIAGNVVSLTLDKPWCRALLEKEMTILGNQVELLSKYFWCFRNLSSNLNGNLPDCVKQKIDWISKTMSQNFDSLEQFAILALVICVFLPEAMDCAKSFPCDIEGFRNDCIFEQVEKNFSTCTDINQNILKTFYNFPFHKFANQAISQLVELEKAFVDRILRHDVFYTMYSSEGRITLKANGFLFGLDYNRFLEGNTDQTKNNPVNLANPVNQNMSLENHEEVSPGDAVNPNSHLDLENHEEVRVSPGDAVNPNSHLDLENHEEVSPGEVINPNSHLDLGNYEEVSPGEVINPNSHLDLGNYEEVSPGDAVNPNSHLDLENHEEVSPDWNTSSEGGHSPSFNNTVPDRERRLKRSLDDPSDCPVAKRGRRSPSGRGKR